jgi:hypothetical protein
MFDPDAVITGEQITALLEAARWAGWRSQPGWGRPFDTETADRSTKPT